MTHISTLFFYERPITLLHFDQNYGRSFLASWRKFSTCVTVPRFAGGSVSRWIAWSWATCVVPWSLKFELESLSTRMSLALSLSQFNLLPMYLPDKASRNRGMSSMVKYFDPRILTEAKAMSTSPLVRLPSSTPASWHHFVMSELVARGTFSFDPGLPPYLEEKSLNELSNILISWAFDLPPPRADMFASLTVC